ncbi:polymorphic toxin type 44 domain-containing protein [Psychrobacter sp. AOP22-C1-C5]|uniref:polymorphic toxin type 44 domain-containing protein n=1 Tax=Psychrobacter sp. AOP22-C1-C5 TaxID=3457716 RepID=UPI0040360CB7
MAVIVCYLFDGFSFESCAIGSDFLSHDKLLVESLVYQVYLYGLFSIAPLDIWSNIHYGYVGRSIGFTANELLTGSNIAQYVSNAVILEISGDTKDDKTAIEIGIELYEKYNLSKNITASIILREITSQPNNKIPVSKVNYYCFR